MKPIGRKLIMDFGKVHVAIEIIPSTVSPYKLPNKNGLLVDIYDFDGERLEKVVGIPLENPYGYSLDGCVPKTSPGFWVTEKEYDSGILKGTLHE